MKQTILMFLLGLSSLIGKANTWTDTGNYDVSWYDDLSTTFHITTEKELAGLAYLCNNGISFSNKTINLQADIDLTNNEWAPITTFDGTLNGNFHTVSNLHIDYKDNLFGITKGFILHNSGKIENLGLQGSVLLVSGGYGAISAGGLCVENYGTIANCTIDCEVKAYSEDNSGPSNGYLHNAGGICVINNGKIINCTNKGDISALPSVWDYRARVNCAGGIAGQNHKEIINCINYGDIATTVGYSSSSWQIGWGLPFGYSGGISGINSGTLNNVVNLGNITATVRKLSSKEGTNA